MKDFIKKNKVYFIVASVLLIYFIVVFVFALVSDKLDKEYANIIIDGTVSWEYKERKWNNVYEFDYLDDDTYYRVYSRSEYYGEYTLRVNNNTLYAFDSDYKSLQYNGSILGVYSNYDINVVQFNYEVVDDSDKQILSSVINNYSNYELRANKIYVDLNSDQVDEIIYVVNFYNSDDIVFSGIYIYNDELRKVVVDNNMASFVYNVSYILDVDNDSSYEIVISLAYMGNTSYSVYKNEKDDYKLFLQ